MPSISDIRKKCEQVIEVARRSQGAMVFDEAKAKRDGRWFIAWIDEPEYYKPLAIVRLLEDIKRLPYKNGRNRRERKSLEQKRKRIKEKAKEIGLI